MSQQLLDLPVRKVYANIDFNGRDIFTVDSVASLAANIEQHGLIFPLLVRPMQDVPKENQVEGFSWSILTGFRRFKAVTEVLGWEKVPCIIKFGCDEEVAKSINLSENIERQDLSPLEAARGMKKHFPNLSTREIGKLLKRSHRWVGRRLQLLTLPHEVQSAIESGRLPLYRALVICDGESRAEQLEIFHELMKPNKRRLTSRPHKKIQRSYKNKTRMEINDLITHLMEYGPECGLSEELVTAVGKVLLWTMNRVSTEELMKVLNLPIPGEPSA